MDLAWLIHMTWCNEGTENIVNLNYLFTWVVWLLSINPTKPHYILFQTKPCWQESGLKILIKDKEIVNAKSTNSLGVIIDSNLSSEVHTERTWSRGSCNLFLINRLSKILYMTKKNAVFWFDLFLSGIWNHMGTYGDILSVMLISVSLPFSDSFMLKIHSHFSHFLLSYSGWTIIFE